MNKNKIILGLSLFIILSVSFNVYASTYKKIELTIGKKVACINGENFNLKVEPTIINGTTMVPIRFVSEALGAKVEWDNKTKKVIIYQGDESVYFHQNKYISNDDDEEDDDEYERKDRVCNDENKLRMKRIRDMSKYYDKVHIDKCEIEVYNGLVDENKDVSYFNIGIESELSKYSGKRGLLIIKNKKVLMPFESDIEYLIDNKYILYTYKDEKTYEEVAVISNIDTNKTLNLNKLVNYEKIDDIDYKNNKIEIETDDADEYMFECEKIYKKID